MLKAKGFTFNCPNDKRWAKAHQVSLSKLGFSVESCQGIITYIKIKFICPYCKIEHETPIYQQL